MKLQILRVAMGAIVATLLSRAALPAATPSEQTEFATPADAAAALIAAAQNHDAARLRAIFGTGSERLVSSGDPYADADLQRRFAALYDEKHVISQEDPNRSELLVGPNDWPFPIPIVARGGKWHFDTAAGAEEIIDRRIGRNELAAIQVCLAYVEAQKDYFERMKQATGTGYYAPRLVSTPGRQDGLYWPVASGQDESPLAPLIASAEEQGYPGEIVGGKPNPYQGYHFRILKAQGPDAPEGARSYVAPSGRMTNGFALIAWPAVYGSSGIMTFEVSQDGIVFQKDLGSDTGQAAARITGFDPDLTWARIDVTDR